MMEWISVEDRLPGLGKRTVTKWWECHGKRQSVPILARFDFEDGTSRVEATTFRTSVGGNGFTLGRGWGYCTQYFTHWSPQPAPPEAGK